MKKIIVAMVVLGLLPITSVPANAEVCTYSSKQVKFKSGTKSYTHYKYITMRRCR